MSRKGKVSLPYIIILNRICERIDDKKVEVKKFREILNRTFRIGNSNMNAVLNDLYKLKVIDYIDHKTILIKW